MQCQFCQCYQNDNVIFLSSHLLFLFPRNCVLQHGHWTPSYSRYASQLVHLLMPFPYLLYSERYLSQIPLQANSHGTKCPLHLGQRSFDFIIGYMLKTCPQKLQTFRDASLLIFFHLAILHK